MNPATIIFIRVATEDHKLGDIKIKKGTFLNVGIGANTLREEIFPEPLKFDPDRFLSEK